MCAGGDCVRYFSMHMGPMSNLKKHLVSSVYSDNDPLPTTIDTRFKNIFEATNIFQTNKLSLIYPQVMT